MHGAEHAHALTNSQGHIISESKNAKDTVNISGDESDICRAAESALLPGGQELAGGGGSVLSCGFQDVSIHA